MNQYERIVSYLYRYESGEKRENSGYAKIERRESECRIQIQTKITAPVSRAKAYLYIQKEAGIQTIEIGNMQIGRNEMRLKARTDINNLFGSGESFDHMDGIFVSMGTTICFATTWKNDYFYQGNWEPEEAKKTDLQVADRGEDDREKDQPAEILKIPGQEEETALETLEKPAEEKESQGSAQGGRNQKATGMPVQMQENQREDMTLAGRQVQMPEEEKRQSAGAALAEETRREEIQKEESRTAWDASESRGQGAEAAVEGKEENCGLKEEDRELQMQSVCGECPLKQKHHVNDYGHRILMSFPTMYPFKEMEKGSCVKMDLQDIGCLPMKFWSLSGNRFLLHGYYCYRHLLFLRTGNGTYALGVPGIYNDKECRSSVRYGFMSFRPLGEEKRQGAFGYWMMDLE